MGVDQDKNEYMGEDQDKKNMDGKKLG